MDERRVALVSGGNRGIGRAVVESLAERGFRVFLGSRDATRGERAAEALVKEGLRVEPVALDVARAESIERLCDDLVHRSLAVEVLINNAGIFPQGNTLDTDMAVFREAMEVHFFGPLRLCQRLLPGMRERKYGRIVNVSSGYGSWSRGLSGPSAYAISKLALNALTVRLAREAGPHVKVNAMCPGWVRTRMGGEGAPRSARDAAEVIVWLATLDGYGPSGGFFRDKKPIDW